MNERMISQDYRHTYARIMETRKKGSRHYIVLGDVVETSEGYIELPDEPEMNSKETELMRKLN